MGEAAKALSAVTYQTAYLQKTQDTMAKNMSIMAYRIEDNQRLVASVASIVITCGNTSPSRTVTAGPPRPSIITGASSKATTPPSPVKPSKASSDKFNIEEMDWAALIVDLNKNRSNKHWPHATYATYTT